MSHEPSHKGHGHDHHHGHDHGHTHRKPGLHKDWRAWLVVGLMLVAMLIYVFTMDESIVPGSNQQGPGMPAAEAPPPAAP